LILTGRLQLEKLVEGWRIQVRIDDFAIHPAPGYLDLLRRRRTAALRTFTATDGVDIAWTLIDESQSSRKYQTRLVKKYSPRADVVLELANLPRTEAPLFFSAPDRQNAPASQSPLDRQPVI